MCVCVCVCVSVCRLPQCSGGVACPDSSLIHYPLLSSVLLKDFSWHC